MTSPTVTVTTPNDTDIVVTREFDAPRHLIFEAHTNPEYLRQWMMGPEGWTMGACEIDLRVGGGYRVVWRDANGQEMTITGEYREITRPERLVSTESWGPEWPEALTILELTEANGRTLLTSTTRCPSKEARDAALKSGMADGQAATFDALEVFLKTLA